MKKLFLILFLLFFSFSGEVLASPVPERYRASSARSVVETQVEGDQVEVYQSVETTVDGETIKKESTQPGKLELEIKKEGENEPTVTFSQEEVSEKPPVSFISQIVDFFRKLFSDLMLRFTQHQP
ncbi:hypothetical protein COU95_01880 [Candidatus Shapirobacteria bacterium CG10_big_fil_rev_8_21_14_0_10_40_9]|uniref:G5 domain-containing protein n=1 Tax=Candidatus Shapirobacteria bacterium CG10_big_fil_rev_8_21_14_0_10_40_9 TaxID=1974888 RepID=A0A2M8L3M3_9BACT|nr:MAG: hypothetical protein COU95_01880 [Candidatus Shapirobacteria bacterium CG10_big_fil_rev_8_21_14_0_10_40_9]